MYGKTGVAIRESLEGELYHSSTFGVLKVKEGERDSEGWLTTSLLCNIYQRRERK